MTGTDRPFRPGLNKRAEPKRQAALQFGLSAESGATACLLIKGYRILARRYKTPVGEIDIIARRRQLLIFVEVKARETLDDAAWSVTDRQKARIVAAAQAWLARLGDDHGFQDMRFDAVLVAPGHIPRHIPAAFEAES